MAVSARKALELLLLTIGVSCVLARPGAPSYPSEEENTIPDYAYDSQEDNGKTKDLSGWKSFPVPSPDKQYDEEAPDTTAIILEIEATSMTTSASVTEGVPEGVPESVPESVPEGATEDKATEIVGSLRAVQVAGSAGAAGAAGAAAAVHAVEVVKAAFETTEVPDGSTTTLGVESGRSLGSGSFRDEKPMNDETPTQTVDQTLYGFSKFLHDLLQVPVQVMRSVGSYLSGALNSRHEVHGAPMTPQNDHALTSAMLSQSF